jgi:hypothetical protein
MRETRARREEVADGVAAGYAEAMIRAKAWTGGPQRGWRPLIAPTPAEAEAVFERIARRFPRAVSA